MRSRKDRAAEDRDPAVTRSPIMSSLNVRDSNIRHIFICAEDKKSLLKDIALIGINEGFHFEDSIDHACAQIKKSIL